MAGKLKKLTEKLSQKIRLRQLLENKRFTIPFSIAVAVVLWLTITINDNPIRQQVFTDIPVNVSIENTVVSEMGLGIIDRCGQLLQRQTFGIVVFQILNGSLYSISVFSYFIRFYKFKVINLKPFD